MGSNSNSLSLKRRDFLAAGATVAVGVAIGGAAIGGETAAATDSIATLPFAPLPRPFPQPPVPVHYWTKGGIIYESEEKAYEHEPLSGRRTAKRHTFQPLETERRFLTVWLKWGAVLCEVPDRPGETIKEHAKRERTAWRAAEDAFPRPQSYVDVPVDASYDSYFYENDGLRMLTREEAIEEVAETNRDFDFSEAGQMNLWAVVVEMGVTPARCTVTSDLAAANVGKITVTVDHPIRVVHPTDEEREMYAIEAGAGMEEGEGAEAVEA